MLDPVMFLGFLIHVLLLGVGCLLFLKRANLPSYDKPFALAILMWATFVLAGHFSSFFGGLGTLSIYIPASFVGLGVLLWLSQKIAVLKPTKPLSTAPKLYFSSPKNEQARKSLWAFLWISLGFFAFCSILLGLSVYPDNADSMIYRLPRAFWYASGGSFLHPFDAIDKRIIFYPLDGVALYIPLVIYGLPGTLHSLPSLISWGLVFYATYRFARSLGGDRLLALFSGWLVAITPGILAQATSTNDEILAAIGFLMALYLMWQWLLSGRHLYFFLGALSFGLGVGTKLHIVFLLPVIFMALMVGIWKIKQKPDRLKLWLSSIGWRTGILSVLMVAVMFAPFLIYNYLSVGRFYFLSDFSKDVFNWQNGLQNAFQNLLIYTSQMVLSPIADLNVWPVANDRQAFNTLLNMIFNPMIEPLLNKDQSFYHYTYRFIGVTIPTSVRFVEFSLWSGFVWLLWGWQSTLALRQKFAFRPIFFLIAMTPFIWFLVWSSTTLYMEGTATYFTYYLVCAAPAAIFLFVPIISKRANKIRWAVAIFVMIAHAIIGVNLLMFSGFRALPDLYYAHKWPYDWDLLEETIIDEIREAKHARVIQTHEKMPYFAYMHWNPRAKFYSPYPVEGLPNGLDVLQILPIPSDYSYGFMPLKIPNKASPGVTYLGTMRGIGREAIFAIGNDVHLRHRAESDYLVPHVTIKPADKGYTVSLDDRVPLLSPADKLEFSYRIYIGDKTVFTRDWDADPVFKTVLPHDPTKYAYYLTLKVRSATSHKALTEATYQVSGPGAWLPDAGEY